MATLVKEKPKQKHKKDKNAQTSAPKTKESKQLNFPASAEKDDLVDILEDPTFAVVNESSISKQIELPKNIVKNETAAAPAKTSAKILHKENTALKKREDETNAQSILKATRELKKDMAALKIKAINQPLETKTESYTFEDIANAFGVKDLIFAKNYCVEFKQTEFQPAPSKHILFESLMALKLARNQLIENYKLIKKLQNETQSNINMMWTVLNNKVSSQKQACVHQKKLSFDVSCQRATFNECKYNKYVEAMALLREKAAESHSTFSHNSHVLQIQIDNLIWQSYHSVETIKDSMRIMFWVMRTGSRGSDSFYQKQLISWSIALGAQLLNKDPTLKSTLFILNYLLRLHQNISWSYGLIQCKVSSMSDIPAALSLFETILLSRQHACHNVDETTPLPYRKSENGDDDTWFVVDTWFGEEAPDAELMVADGATLRESDLLGLIAQIPFDEVFKEMMLVKSNTYELIFCGESLSADLVLKIFCGARIAFSIIRNGLLLYDKYKALSIELCKLTQHYVLYSTDLWEATSLKWDMATLKRLSVEYDNLFRAGWSTIECCSFKEIAVMFQSLLPFKLIPETTLFGMFEEITGNLIVADDDQCYHALETLANMAIARSEEDFVLKVLKYIFSIGFTTENALKGCGAVARKRCGSVLKHHLQHISRILPEMSNVKGTEIPQGEWLELLPLLHWRPSSSQLMFVLNSWNAGCQEMLPYLIQSMDWSCRSGLPLTVQREVAIFLSGLSQSAVRRRSPIPSWIFDCLITLRIHAVDWCYTLEMAPEPQTLQGLEVSELLIGSTTSATARCHASAMVVLAATSWGHSMPLLFEKGVHLLIRLANAGRHREVVHLLYYTITVLTQSPKDIKDSESFKELLSTLLNSDRSYAKMATRFITGDVPGPIAKLLTDLLKTQITHYQAIALTSPAPILSVWLHWLMSLDGWSSDFPVLYLADTAISCCFYDGQSMIEAFDIFKSYVESRMSKSNSSGLFGGSWFLGSGGTFKGIIQCPSAEVPLLWLLTLQVEHVVFEKIPGLWGRLINKLTEQREGKTNIDKAFKSVGGQGSASGLTLYHAAEYAITTPITHPYHAILWQFFFSLYLDTSTLDYTQQSKPVGHLFFRGVVNSRLLTRLRSRLDDARSHHEAQHKRFSQIAQEKTLQGDQPSDMNKSTGPEYSQRAEFHKNQTMYMDAFKLWLDEKVLQDLIDGKVSMNSAQFMFAKLETLMQGRFNPWFDTIEDIFDCRRSLPQWPAVLLEAKQAIAQEDIPHSPIIEEPSPSERILRRLRESCEEKSTKQLRNDYDLFPTLSPTISPKEALALAGTALSDIKKFDQYFTNAQNIIVAEDNVLLCLIKQMFKDNTISYTLTKYCGDQTCTGVNVNIQYIESQLDNTVMAQISANRVSYGTSLDKVVIPFEHLAKMTEVLVNVSQLPWTAYRNQVPASKGATFFRQVLEASSGLSCLPLRDAVSTAASKLGTAFVSSSGTECLEMIKNCGKNLGENNDRAYERRAAIVGSLLQPLELPTDDYIDVYRAITTTIPDPHIAFSLLSKFDVSSWLRNRSPSQELTWEFVNLLVHKLAASGPKPPPKNCIVQELLCVHLCRTLQWSWPLHLPGVLKELAQLACDDQLPPEIWEHVAKIIELNSNKTQLQCCTLCGPALGKPFELARRRRMPRATWQGSCQAIHAEAMARIGAAVSAAATAAAMLHQPTILADQVAQLVFTISCSIFDPWLVPWWAGHSGTADEAHMPWGPQDVKLVEILFDAFLESMLYIINTLPGSEISLLRCLWSWYIWHHHRYNLHQRSSQHWQTLPEYIIVLTHQQLARLPWHQHSWATVNEIQSIVELSGRPHFNDLAAYCMRGFRYEYSSWDWICGDSNLLNLALICLINLPLQQEVIDDATYNLPWCILSSQFLNDILIRFFSSLSLTVEVLSQHRLIRLLSAASGLVSNKETRCLNKQLAFVQHCSIFLERKSSKELRDLGKDMTCLLETIENGYSNEESKDYISEGDLASCKVLFDVIVGLLNVESLRDHVLQEWIQFLSKCNRLSSRAIVCCISKITHKDTYSLISEAALSAYFRNGDDWNRLATSWKTSNNVKVVYLIQNCSLIAAFVSLIFLPQELRIGHSVALDKNVLKALTEINPSSKNEMGIILWIHFILSQLSSQALPSQGAQVDSKVQLSSIIKHWSEEQGWGILKVIGLGQNTAPSNRFRIAIMYSRSIKLYIYTNKSEIDLQLITSGSPHFKTVKTLDSMVNQKACSDIKEAIKKCLEWSKSADSFGEWKSHLKELCKDLYPNFMNLYQFEF